MSSPPSEQIIKFLPPENYKSFLKGADDGKSGLTHLAEVTWDDDIERNTWVKIYTGNKERSLINELVSFLLGSALGLPMPERAGLLMLETKVLNENIVNTLSEVDKYRGYTFAWVSQDLGGKNVRLELEQNPTAQSIMIKYLMTDLTNWKYLAKMLAFDDLILNTDRNMGNLIQLPTKEFCLIDHGEALHGQWKESDLLDHDCEHEGKLDQIFYKCLYDNNNCHGLFQFDKTLEDLETAKSSHAIAFKAVYDELKSHLSNMIGEEKVKTGIKEVNDYPVYETLLSFLENRASNLKGFTNRCEDTLKYHSIPFPLS